MTRLVSTKVMIDQLEGMLHTRDLTLREADFVASMVRERDANGAVGLSEKRLEWLTDLWRRHFA